CARGHLCRAAPGTARPVRRVCEEEREVERTNRQGSLSVSMMAMVETTAQTLADIAVLDDDLDFRTYLEDFLKDEGAYTVRTFGNAADFFAGCEERLPDIVPLDMKMGDVTGDKVLEQLLTRWPGLCVIVITG